MGKKASESQYNKSRKLKLARLEIVGRYYKRGYTFRQIRDITMKELGLATYSLKTVYDDAQTLLKEWRDERVINIDQGLQLEIAQYDEIIRECWAEWEKSKTDHVRTTNKRKGLASPDGVETIYAEETEMEVIKTGDPRYIQLIMNALDKKRKLLGGGSQQINIKSEKYDDIEDATIVDMIPEDLIDSLVEAIQDAEHLRVTNKVIQLK